MSAPVTARKQAQCGVLIADDHPIYRDGLAQAVEARSDLRFVGEASDGRQALERARELQPEVVVVDIRMPGLDGLEVLAAIGRDYPETRVLILSAHVDGETIYRALADGAAGFISKDAPREAICDAIAAVARGEIALSREVEADLASEIRKRRQTELAALTEREVQVLRRVAEGESAAEIGRRLYLSPTTVKSHLRNLYAKLEVGDRAAAVAEAMRRGLID
jgi:two-component system, NarL family, nitrate/nitrite response regulator NarL